MSKPQDLETLIRNVGGDPADLPFWRGCAEGRFLLHRCNLCQRHYWPASRCIEHGDEDMQWVESSGRGQLYTYTVMHKALIPSMRERVPYVVAVVQLDEGPMYHSNIVECDYTDVRVGMRLAAVMTEHENGMALPVFKPEAG